MFSPCTVNFLFFKKSVIYVIASFVIRIDLYFNILRILNSLIVQVTVSSRFRDALVNKSSGSKPVTIKTGCYNDLNASKIVTKCFVLPSFNFSVSIIVNLPSIKADVKPTLYAYNLTFLGNSILSVLIFLPCALIPLLRPGLYL